MSDNPKLLIIKFVLSIFLMSIGVIILINNQCSWGFIGGLFIILWANNISIQR